MRNLEQQIIAKRSSLCRRWRHLVCFMSRDTFEFLIRIYFHVNTYFDLFQTTCWPNCIFFVYFDCFRRGCRNCIFSCIFSPFQTTWYQSVYFLVHFDGFTPFGGQIVYFQVYFDGFRPPGGARAHEREGSAQEVQTNRGRRFVLPQQPHCSS